MLASPMKSPISALLALLAGVTLTGCNALECLDFVQVNATFIRSSVGQSPDPGFNLQGDFHLKYSRSQLLATDYDSFDLLDNLFGSGRGVNVQNGQASISYAVPGANQKNSNGTPTSCTTADDITPTLIEFTSGDLTLDALPSPRTSVDSVTFSGPTLVIQAIFDEDNPSGKPSPSPSPSSDAGAPQATANTAAQAQ